MGAAAPARPGLVEACNEEVRRTAEPRSAATAGPAVRDYSGQPVPAALGGRRPKHPHWSKHRSAFRCTAEPLGRPVSVVL